MGKEGFLSPMFHVTCLFLPSPTHPLPHSLLIKHPHALPISAPSALSSNVLLLGQERWCIFISQKTRGTRSAIPEIGDGFFSQRCKQNQKVPVLTNGHAVVPQLLCAGGTSQ